MLARSTIGCSGSQQNIDEQILSLQNINKFFASQHILKDFDLNIGKGEFVTLLGPSGCGKSTTLNIVAGLTTPDSGHMLMRGRSALHLAPQKRQLGMVFQSWALFPHMTVFENVSYGLRMKGISDAAELRRLVGEALELVRLVQAEKKYPSQLSGGMQQRVALARALVTKPDLLLLDEPLSNLDAALRREMQLEIKSIHDELKVTTLLVTHSQEEALVMSDRIAVMRGGRIERIAPPREIYVDPHTEFVCTFVGDANIFSGKIVSRNNGRVQISTEDMSLSAAPHPFWEGTSEISFAVRPESIIIQSIGAPTGENAATGRVTNRIFKGNMISYNVQLGSFEIELLALCHNASQLFERGDEVTISFAGEDVIALKKEGSAA
jgi:ABC-type Fe3+/spermidine/putrescine transport system ATPase subunit